MSATDTVSLPATDTMPLLAPTPCRCSHRHHAVACIKRAYPLEEIRRMTAKAGWIGPRIEVTSVGFEAWLPKGIIVVKPQNL